ncbi:DUF429 domain-containing protein [Parvularcula oceani]|uniref:DUF429 domain-containing protein n=1 Tax=Parvularcula oceani TaxID=1247963 RepID=UPI002351E524|nr:DUF429 domain-containing protein [Parvularcula oceani]
MPATQRGESGRVHSLGVDGCPSGWIAVGAAPAQGCGGATGSAPRLDLRWGLFPSLNTLLDAAIAQDASAIVIDIPIGLPAGGPRACDAAARARLGPRRSSVFPAPSRGMLDAQTYAEAQRLGRQQTPPTGLSRQSFAILPKVREADRALTPDRQTRILEGHPELAFTRLAGVPLEWPKRSASGLVRRIDLLRRHGAAGMLDLLAAVEEAHPRKAVAPDDVLDAAVLALTGQALAQGTAWRLGDGGRDARGLLMEICG